MKNVMGIVASFLVLFSTNAANEGGGDNGPGNSTIGEKIECKFTYGQTPRNDREGRESEIFLSSVKGQLKAKVKNEDDHYYVLVYKLVDSDGYQAIIERNPIPADEIFTVPDEAFDKLIEITGIVTVDRASYDEVGGELAFGGENGLYANIKCINLPGERK